MKLSKGLTAETGKPETPHEPGGVYDVEYQDKGAENILASDDDGNEFPAPEGWYYKQFVPAPWAAQEWMSVDGWFGPFASVDDMPDYVKENLTTNK